MKLPWYIFSKGRFLHHFPWIGKLTAQSLGPIILIPDNVYRDLKTRNPNPKHIALLIHEETHRKRQKKMGYLKFAFRYVFDSKFRFQEELLAVEEGMKYLKKKKIPFDFDKYAKFLSSNIYLWPVSKKYAEQELKRIWVKL